VTNATNVHVFSVCSSVVGWWGRSINYPLLSS